MLKKSTLCSGKFITILKDRGVLCQLRWSRINGFIMSGGSRFPKIKSMSVKFCSNFLDWEQIGSIDQNMSMLVRFDICCWKVLHLQVLWTHMFWSHGRGVLLCQGFRKSSGWSGISKCHGQSWLFDQIGRSLIPLVIVYHADYRFKF